MSRKLNSKKKIIYMIFLHGVLYFNITELLRQFLKGFFMYIITGGAGFIGSVLIKKLNDSGITGIIVVDELGKQDKWKNLRGKNFIRYYDKKEFRGLISTRSFPYKAKAIIHLGACSDTTEQDMGYLYENNTEYSILLLEYALKKDIRFLYASSAAVYGDGSNGFSDNYSIFKELKPLNKYGFSKWLFDNYIYLKGYEKRCTGLRFFNVYGPNEYHKGHMSSVIYKAYNQIKQTGKMKLFKSEVSGLEHGEQKRDFIYVKDVVDIIQFFINTGETGIYNVGTGQANSFNGLAVNVFNAMQKAYDVEYIEMPEKLKGKYQNYTCGEIELLRAAGYTKAFTPFDKAVSDYVKNYLEAGSFF